MDQNLEKFEVIRNIEKLYEEVFTRKGMGSFMKLAWNNIKEEFNSDPHIFLHQITDKKHYERQSMLYQIHLIK